MGTERVRLLFQVTQPETDAVLGFTPKLPAPVISSPRRHTDSLSPSVFFVGLDVAVAFQILP